jgi:hypothetical protein
METLPAAVQQLEREANYHRQAIPKLRISGAVPPLPHNYFFMALTDNTRKMVPITVAVEKARSFISTSVFVLMVQTQDKRQFFTLYAYSINYIRRDFRRRKSVHRKTNKVFYFVQNEHNLTKKKVQCKVYLCTLSVSVGEQWYFISECWTAMVLYFISEC